jgi:hypothetical protein
MVVEIMTVASLAAEDPGVAWVVLTSVEKLFPHGMDFENDPNFADVVHPKDSIRTLEIKLSLPK